MVQCRTQQAAWLALHRTLDASLHVAAAGGGAGGGGGAWREAERHDLVLCLRAMWRGQRAALFRVLAICVEDSVAEPMQTALSRKAWEASAGPAERARPGGAHDAAAAGKSSAAADRHC